MVYRSIPELPKPRNGKLSAQADLELARRSVPSCLFHFVLLLVVGFCTPYRHEHATAVWSFAAALLTLGAVRMVIGLSFPTRYPRNPVLWRRLFEIGTCGAAIGWSLFTCVSLRLYSHEWIGWLVLLVTAGIVAGANTSLSPDLALSASYAIILLVPPLVLSIVGGALSGYSTAFVVFFFLVFLLIQGRQHYRSYWEAIRMSALLEERGAYLQALTEESPLAIAVLDREHRVQICNRAFQELFLFEEKELAGRKLYELFRTAPAELAQFNQVAEAGKPAHLTTRRPRKDGTEVDVEINAVPLMLNGKMNGLLILYRDITDRKQAEERLRKRSAEISLLSEMASLLQACQTVEEACEVIRVAAHRLLPNRPGSLSTLSASGKTVETIAVWGEGYAGERVFSPEDCWALRRGQLHRFAAESNLARCRHVAQAEVAESVCVPLLGQGEVLGILHLQTSGEATRGAAPIAGQTAEAEQELATLLAEQIALSLSGLRLREKLRNQSIRDPLTGLFNRRYMEESLERELARAIRTKNAVCLIMMDIDHFKRFNDTCGHLAGDALLRALGDFLIRQTRKQDVICRYGGEEFALVLSGASVEGALIRAEVLRQEIKQLSVQHAGQLLGAISLSMGIAEFPRHASTVQEMLQVADHALYQAKQEGRDRVVAATPIPQEVSGAGAPPVER